MKTKRRYSHEVREKAVRMVLEHRGEYDSQGAALGSISQKIGGTAETLGQGVRQARPDSPERYFPIMCF